MKSFIAVGKTNSVTLFKLKKLFFQFLPLLLAALFFVACDADAPDIDPQICDAYQDTLFTMQVAGGAAVVIGLGLLALKKSLASIMPSQGAQTGAIATAVVLGVVLLTFSTEWGTRILTIFGLPDMWALCGFA